MRDVHDRRSVVKTDWQHLPGSFLYVTRVLLLVVAVAPTESLVEEEPAAGASPVVTEAGVSLATLMRWVPGTIPLVSAGNVGDGADHKID